MKLSEKDLQFITQTASQEAVRAYRQHTEESEGEKQDRRLRNFKLLLKHYRSLVLHCENIEKDLIDFQDTSIQELDISTINLEKSIKKSKRKSYIMVMFVQGKMEAYKRSCSQDEMKYFRVLEMKYITKKK